MKKIITLVFAALAFGAVHAQSREEARRIILGEGSNRNGGGSSERSRDIILGDGNGNESNRRTYPNSYPSSREAEVDRINRDYDYKISSIRNNPNLSSQEKARIIRQLENDRARKIREAGDYRDNNYKKDKKYKSNNGKHKGWSKGKGNKHRDRDDD